MAKHFIFDKVNKGIVRIADSDEKKNAFVGNHTIYVTAEVSDADYNFVKLGQKDAKYENGSAVLVDYVQGDNYFFSTDINEAKEQIKDFITVESLANRRSGDGHTATVLESIQYNNLTEVPTQKVPEWVLSQVNPPLKRFFEL